MLAQRPREFYTPPQPRAKGRVTRGSLRLAFELFGVFVGVSAAFMGENYRETVEREKQARQIYSALSQEVEDFVIRGQRLHDLETASVSGWEAARASGTAAPRTPARAVERPSRAAWDATVASGAIRLIDHALFYQLAQHYERLSMQEARRGRLEEMEDRGAGGAALVERRRGMLRENQENIGMAAPLLVELRRRVTAP
ncbi:MAG TPA: hypothetical protein VF613_02380 [Longimicrobium sp.]